MDEFEKELTNLINKHSVENLVHMPDFLLSRLLVSVIVAIAEPIKNTLDWHGTDWVCHPKSDGT
jgi:hypothetical protein